MASFIKIGRQRINLDAVVHVHEWKNGACDVWFSDSDSIALCGDHARQFLAIIDRDRVKGPSCQSLSCTSEATVYVGERRYCDAHAPNPETIEVVGGYPEMPAT